MKPWLICIGGWAVAAFLVWFGLQFFFFDGTLSGTALFIMGLISVLGGIFILPTSGRGKIPAGTALILLGVFFFARAAGILEGAWFTRLLGIASFAAAAIVAYVTFPQSNEPPQSV